MHYLAITTLVAALMAGPAWAQNTTAAPASPASGSTTGSSNNAVNDTGNISSNVNASGTIQLVSPSALEQGANSFTEGQVRSRIESAGFTEVTNLKKDGQGIWRGNAKKGSQSVAVGFDYKGNMAAN